VKKRTGYHPHAKATVNGMSLTDHTLTRTETILWYHKLQQQKTTGADVPIFTAVDTAQDVHSDYFDIDMVSKEIFIHPKITNTNITNTKLLMTSHIRSQSLVD